MTTLIVLNVLFAVIAVGALVFLKRVAYKAGLGRFDAPEIRLRDEPQELRRAA
jgi:hypothetical protein